MKLKISFVRVLALTCSLLFTAGFIGYRMGVFSEGGLLGDIFLVSSKSAGTFQPIQSPANKGSKSPGNADENSTIMSGSKSTFGHVSNPTPPAGK